MGTVTGVGVGEKPHRGAFLAESKHFPGTLLTGE